MSVKPNPYYEPDEWGCVEVGNIERSEPDWSFDTIAVLKHVETGTYYVGTDSGCSCPTPFENYANLDDFTGPLTAEQCAEEVINLWLDTYTPYRQDAFVDLLCDILGTEELPGEQAAQIINGLHAKKD